MREVVLSLVAVSQQAQVLSRARPDTQAASWTSHWTESYSFRRILEKRKGKSLETKT